MTEPPIDIVAAAQKAILNHPYFHDGAAIAFGFANAAIKAALAATPARPQPMFSGNRDPLESIVEWTHETATPAVAGEQLWGRFVNHYWDSLEGVKPIVLLHVRAVLDYHAANSAQPASPLLGREEALEKALTNLCDEIGNKELHGDGAHDSSCSICRSHTRARKLLSTASDGETKV